MTGGHDPSTEASDDAFTEEADRGTNAWSLLYADAPLKPTSCPDCGNVFATDSTSCPWCGRIVTASERGAVLEPVGDDTSAPVMPTAAAAAVAHDPLEYPSPSSAEAAAAYRARQARSAESAAGLRRWASLLLAAAVLLVIATGLTIRARNSRTSSAATTTVTTAARSTVSINATASSSTAASATPSTSTVTSASDATVPTTTPSVTTVATPSGSSTTVTTVAPRFTAEQQQALELAQSLSTALATKDWSRVREITANRTPTDAQFEAGYGTLTRVDVVPAKIDKLTESTYDVFAGVVQVKNANGSITSTLYCNKYSVDLLAKTVNKIRATEPLRSVAGAVSVDTVSDELASACVAPNLTA